MRTVLDELTQNEPPSPTRALPLDLGCYISIRKAAYEPRHGRGGRMERVDTAHRRGAQDIAMMLISRVIDPAIYTVIDPPWGMVI